MSFRSCLLFLLVFSACESTIDINTPEDYTPQLVVDGFFNPDSVWSMVISQSLPLNSYREPSELLVENANVSNTGKFWISRNIGAFRERDLSIEIRHPSFG